MLGIDLVLTVLFQRECLDLHRTALQRERKLEMDEEIERLRLLDGLAKPTAKINIKKNSAFIKRLKTPQSDWAVVTQELATLNLST